MHFARLSKTLLLIIFFRSIMPIRLKDPCGQCGRDDPSNFRLYRTTDAYIGKYCINCGTEWLKEEYLTAESRRYNGIADNVFISEADIYQNNGIPDNAFVNEDDLYENVLVTPKVIKAFQVRSARTKIDTRYFAEILKPGDHITWHRPRGYWHHSIVSEVKGDKNEIVVIHWSKPEIGCQTRIYEEPLTMNTADGESLFNQMYRIDYPDEINKMNSRELVLVRARSRLDNDGYNFFTDNCEAFATYCKTGVPKSHQVSWLLEKMKESCGLANVEVITKHGLQLFATKAKAGIPLATGEVVPSEVIQHALNTSQAVGAGVIMMIETGFVIWDLSQAYAERKDSTLSRNDFIEAAARRIIEGIVSCGFTIVCSVGLEVGLGLAFGAIFGGPVGVVIGGIIGGLIGGIAGGAVGRAIGTLGGSVAGKMIASCFPNDRAVLKVNQLKPGDHIILSGWFLHPRCHAIVVDHRVEKKQREKFVAIGSDGEEDEYMSADDDEEEEDSEVEDGKGGEILVIRNTHQHGVVEEWVMFEHPVYRVEYNKGESMQAEQVIATARSKIGQNRYNLARYNCKTFARECKTLAPIENYHVITESDFTQSMKVLYKCCT